MRNKKKILVLMGGPSSEYKVSVSSGKQVLIKLDKEKYSVSSMILPKSKLSLDKYINKIAKTRPDVVFITMHGKHGEDGCIQGVLELLGMCYTGSGIYASSCGMDKLMFKKVIKNLGVNLPESFVVDKNNIKKPVKKIKFPVFVKPYNHGSSIGVSMASNMPQYINSIKLALSFSDKAIVEEYIKGVDVTCSVLGNNKPKALPLIEINPHKGSFFDYKSKYTESGAEEICPAKIPTKLTIKMQKTALEIYKYIGCSGFARVDFILKSDGTFYVLEINTIPGLTPTSLFPKSAKSAGMTYGQLLDSIISYAIHK